MNINYNMIPVATILDTNRPERDIFPCGFSFTLRFHYSHYASVRVLFLSLLTSS